MMQQILILEMEVDCANAFKIQNEQGNTLLGKNINTSFSPWIILSECSEFLLDFVA